MSIASRRFMASHGSNARMPSHLTKWTLNCDMHRVKASIVWRLTHRVAHSFTDDKSGIFLVASTSLIRTMWLLSLGKVCRESGSGATRLTTEQCSIP